MYPASGAVGPVAPEGSKEVVGRLRKDWGGVGEPNVGRRGGAWVGPNGAGARQPGKPRWVLLHA